MSTPARNRFQEMVPSLVLLILVAAYLVIGYLTLDEESGVVPIMTAYLTLFLLLVDLFSTFKGKHAGMNKKAEEAVPLSTELRATLSLLCLVAAIYFVGFYLAGFIYLVMSLFWIARQSLRFSIITAVLTFAAIYLTFEKGLSFELFRGVFLS